MKAKLIIDEDGSVEVQLIPEYKIENHVLKELVGTLKAKIDKDYQVYQDSKVNYLSLTPITDEKGEGDE